MSARRVGESSYSVYRVVRGDPASPVILHVPHASRIITSSARRSILLDDAALSTELDLMTDGHTDVVASRASQASPHTPWMFINRYSRLVVDPERFPDEREEMRAVGMAAVYLRTSQGRQLRAEDRVHVEDLLAAHYHPYAAAMAELVDDRLAATGRAVIIDVHSYPSVALPYELHPDGSRAAVCLGTDPAHTPAALLDAARRAFAPCGDVSVNTPFSGCYVPLKHYQQQTAVAAIMIEIRRDTYTVEPGGPLTDGIDRVVRALTRLIETVPTRI